MAFAQAASVVENILGHAPGAAVTQDITNPAKDRARYGHPTEKMKALTWQGKNKVKLVEVPKPIVVDPGDIILKVTGSTICGSDLHLLHGAILEMEQGDILGHEFCGVVEELGPDAKGHGFDVGDRCVASFQIACGSCMYCQKKLSSQCEKTNTNTIEGGLYGGRTAGMFGYSHLTGGFCGGQSEYVRVPFGTVNLLHIPRHIPDEKALYLSDVLATSWHCVVDTGVKDGDVVAIWGAGPIGQMTAEFAFMNGASRVILIDQNWRLDYCKKKIPRVETVNFAELPKGTTLVDKLKQMNHGGPDVALECAAGEYPKGMLHSAQLAVGLETDTPELLNECIMAVRSFGRVGVTGIYAGFVNGLAIGALMERGIMLKGNGQAPVHLYWKQLLNMIDTGDINPLKMLSHRVALEDMEKVYEKYDKREEGMQKVFVATQFSQPPCAGGPELTRC